MSLLASKPRPPRVVFFKSQNVPEFRYPHEKLAHTLRVVFGLEHLDASLRWTGYERASNNQFRSDIRSGGRVSPQSVYYASSISHDSESSSQNSGFKYRISGAASLRRMRRSEKEMNRHTSKRGGDRRLKVGRLTSSITFCLRSSGATRYKGILRFGCMAMRSDIRR